MSLFKEAGKFILAMVMIWVALFLLAALAFVELAGSIYSLAKKSFSRNILTTKNKSRWWARQVHNDMFDKILELKNDQSMNDYEWQEWLSVCRYSDELYRKSFPKENFNSLEDMVLRSINGEEALT